MNDLTLLAHPYWDDLTDTQLQHAVLQAQARGALTFKLLHARASECDCALPMASTNLYGQHCVLIAPDGERLWQQWQSLKTVDLCTDPRMAWFCTIYSQHHYKHLQIDPLSKNPTVLCTRSNHALERLMQVRTSLEAGIRIYESSSPMDRPKQGWRLWQSQKVHQRALDFAMLTLMEYNTRMDELVS